MYIHVAVYHISTFCTSQIELEGRSIELGGILYRVNNSCWTSAISSKCTSKNAQVEWFAKFNILVTKQDLLLGMLQFLTLSTLLFIHAVCLL